MRSIEDDVVKATGLVLEDEPSVGNSGNGAECWKGERGM